MERREWVRRRLWGPLQDQLRQGVTPEKLAWSVALGITFGCFPIFGATTVLCILFGMTLRLNQPAIQIFNHLSAPLQLALIVPFLRMGNRLFGAGPAAQAQLQGFLHGGLGAAVRVYGMTFLRGAVAWCLIAPVAAYLIHLAVLPALRGLSRAGVVPR